MPVIEIVGQKNAVLVAGRLAKVRIGFEHVADDHGSEYVSQFEVVAEDLDRAVFAACDVLRLGSVTVDGYLRPKPW